MLSHDLICSFRIVAYHTEVCKLRCVKAAETVDIDLILCKNLCNFLKTAWSVFYEDDVLFYHNNFPLFCYSFLFSFFILA